MLTKAPACRAVCKGKPGAVMDELVAVMTDLRLAGKAEAEVLFVARDPVALARLFPEGSLGRYPSVAESFVDSGCSECAVNKAYADEMPSAGAVGCAGRHGSA